VPSGLQDVHGMDSLEMCSKHSRREGLMNDCCNRLRASDSSPA
jgi:hypothetical protein